MFFSISITRREYFFISVQLYTLLRISTHGQCWVFVTWCQRVALLCCPEPSSSAQYSVCQFLWSYESQWHTFGQQMVDTAWKQNNDKQVNAHTNNWIYYTCTPKSKGCAKSYLNKRIAIEQLKTIESCAQQSCQTPCSSYRLHNRVSLKVSPKGSLHVHICNDHNY